MLASISEEGSAAGGMNEQQADQEEEEEREVVYEEGRLSCSSRNWVRIPFNVLRLYGPRADFLDLSSNRLRDLKGLECFTLLQELVLDNNELSSGMRFPRMDRLHTLSLNKNHVSDLEEFIATVQRNLPNLRFLSLLHNPACPDALCASPDSDEDDYRRYRLFVIRKLTRLRFLDSKGVTERERREALRTPEEILRPVRVRVEDVQDTPRKKGFWSSMDADYSPLPQSLAKPGRHRGRMTKTSPSRTSNVRGSEGNKFIHNRDL